MGIGSGDGEDGSLGASGFGAHMNPRLMFLSAHDLMAQRLRMKLVTVQSFSATLFVLLQTFSQKVYAGH